MADNETDSSDKDEVWGDVYSQPEPEPEPDEPEPEEPPVFTESLLAEKPEEPEPDDPDEPEHIPFPKPNPTPAKPRPLDPEGDPIPGPYSVPPPEKTWRMPMPVRIKGKPQIKRKKRGKATINTKHTLAGTQTYIPLLAAALAREKRDEAEGIKPPTWREIHDWVGSNLLSKVVDLDPESIPCRKALVILEQARKNRWEYLKIFEAKMAPTKSQTEAEEELRDDGRSVRQLLEDWESFGGEPDDVGSPVGEPVLSPSA